MIWELRDSLGKKATEQAGVEGDWTAAFLYFGLMKNSCRACLLLYCFFGNKKRRAYKSFLDLRFHPLIIEFFWFALARHCSASRKTHTNVVVVSRGFRGRGWGFISSAWCACVCVCACVRVCVCVCVCGGEVWGG